MTRTDSLLGAALRLLPDAVVEIEPIRPKGGRIVWQWHVWDHLVQNYDPTKANYGVPSNHVELINANCGALQQFWNHFNGIDYNPQLDQILISSRNQCEIWVIEHGTNTAQTAGHTGGRYGKGGDLLYRWGNPAAYRLGAAADRQLVEQHDAEWIPDGLPGAKAAAALIRRHPRARPRAARRPG